VFQGQMIKGAGQGTGNNLPQSQRNMFHQGYCQICLQILSFTGQKHKVDRLDVSTVHSLRYFSLQSLYHTSVIGRGDLFQNIIFQ
jgi:hypothetical protein